MSGSSDSAILVFASRQPEAERQRRGWIETRIQSAQFLEAAHHQTGGDQQYERQRDLSPHQQMTYPMTATTGRAVSATVIKKRRNRYFAEQRNRTECKRNQQRQHECECDSHTVESNFFQSGQSCRCVFDKEPKSPGSEGNTDGARRDREQNA